MDNNVEINSDELFEKAKLLFEAGNFKQSKEVFKKVLEANPQVEIKEKSDLYLEKLSFDYVELAIGIVSFLILSFIFIYFGFIR